MCFPSCVSRLCFASSKVAKQPETVWGAAYPFQDKPTEASCCGCQREITSLFVKKKSRALTWLRTLVLRHFLTFCSLFNIAAAQGGYSVVFLAKFFDRCVCEVRWFFGGSYGCSMWRLIPFFSVASFLSLIAIDFALSLTKLLFSLPTWGSMWFKQIFWG